MSRLRTIKPEFWTSEQVVECSRNARLLFVGLWNFCDDHGRIKYAPKQIKGLIFPCDDLSTADISQWIGELLKNRLVGMYEVKDEKYLLVTGWHHQRIDKKQDAKFPEPPTNVPLSFDDNSANIPGTFATELIGTEPSRVEREERKKHTKKEDFDLNGHAEPPKPRAKPERTADFEEFYAAYPKKVNPKDAAASFAKAVKSGVNPKLIIAAAGSWAQAWRLAGTEQTYIPAPAAWLNKGAYDSQDLPKSRAPPALKSPFPPGIPWRPD